MELYLLRHGIAEPRAASGDDADRALTAEGIHQLRAVIQQSCAAGLAPRAIVASPYLRAQQTARIAAEVAGYAGVIHSSLRLRPASAPAELWDEVCEWYPDSPLLLVAHEPLLSAAAAWLTGETRTVVEFRPATIARLDFPGLGRAPRGALRWKIHAA
jgi:phosphohistidine phosphatase